jgi:hypothetical protein
MTQTACGEFEWFHDILTEDGRRIQRRAVGDPSRSERRPLVPANLEQEPLPQARVG